MRIYFFAFLGALSFLFPSKGKTVYTIDVTVINKITLSTLSQKHVPYEFLTKVKVSTAGHTLQTTDAKIPFVKQNT